MTVLTLVRLENLLMIYADRCALRVAAARQYGTGSISELTLRKECDDAQRAIMDLVRDAISAVSRVQEGC